MKKLFTLIAILFSSSSFLYAQNNLQFNSAKYIKLSVATGQGNKDTSITVPTNKVWKVESGSMSMSGYSLTLDEAFLVANATYLPYGPHYSDGVFPIWLPSGTYTFNFITVNSVIGSAFISAIEFNLVP